MKQKKILALFALLIPWNVWASSTNMHYEDGDSFTAFVPLNGNDSVEMTFYVISEEGKTISVGINEDNWDSSACIDISVKGKIEIPSSINGYSLTTIGYKAFYGCDELTSITVPSTVTEIGCYAFDNCQNLDSILILSRTLPLLNIGLLQDVYDFMLEDYENIDPFPDNSEIYVPASIIESYKKSRDWRYLADKIYAIEGETDYDIQVYAQSNSSDVSSKIGEQNLAHIISLKLTGTINGYDVKVIREMMPLLKYLDLSDVEIVDNDYVYFTDENDNDFHTMNNVLGDYFFYNMQNLYDIKLPKQIDGFGEYVFGGCNNLKNVTINIQTPLPITETTFPNRSSLSLLVPSKEEYLMADNWKDFKEINDISDIIQFEDKTVENICVSNWDTNGDGKLSKGEAANVTDLYSYFACTDITSFNELQYFTGLYEIRGICFENCSELTSIFIPKNVNTISFDGIHMFGNQYIFFPFYGCDNLKEVHISNLKSWMNIDFDYGIYCNPLYYAGHLYIENQEVTDLVIPEDITTIKPNTFAGFKGLTNVTIPNGTIIEHGAFNGCENLETIVISENVTINGGGDEWGYFCYPTIYHPEDDTWEDDCYECVDYVWTGVFDGCDKLTKVKNKNREPFLLDGDIFPNRANATLYVLKGCKSAYESADYWKDFKEIIEVENIDDYVQGEIFTVPVDLDTGEKVLMTFKVTDAANKKVQVGVGDESASIMDSTVGSLIIPSKVNGYTVTNIGSYAFYYCSNLTSVSIPNTVKTIGNRAFYVCSGLTSLHIPASVTSIEDRAFAYCSGLETIEVEAGNKYYDSRNSCNALIQTKTNTLLIGCKNSLIPEGVTIIADGAFRGCAELESIEIPEGVTKIGSAAFRGCTGLTSVTLPSTITSIGTYAFSAFDEVYNLTTVTVGMTTPVAITSEVFPNRANSTLYVPKGCKTAYQAANYWKEFKVIKEIGDYDFTDISQLANAIYMDEKTVIPGNRFVLPIKIKNEQLVTGFQFDMELPKGISIARNDNNKFIVAMSERGNNFNLSCAKRSESTYRFVVLSTNNEMESGDDVTMRISIDVSDDMAIGTYCVKFKNGEFSGKSGNNLTRIQLEEVTSPIKVKEMLLGDINDDNAISIVDVVGLVGYILGERYDNFVVTAADVNGDGMITIADVVALIGFILNDDSYAKPNPSFVVEEE